MKGVKELPPDSPQSFFMIGGFHGEPLRGPGATDPAFWGGYCNHGNVLFPTWHRVYLLKLEEALQSVLGCEDVMLPYWDETNDDSLKNGLPWALNAKDFVQEIQVELDRRRPGQSRIVTPRNEPDALEILSGVVDDVTIGTPIAKLVRNKDQRSQDFDTMAVTYRPSHADAAYDAKYGIRAVAGGGRSSARETIGRVAAGAIAKKLLREYAGVQIAGYVQRVRHIEAPEIDPSTVTMAEVEANIVRCPHPETAEAMIQYVDEIRKSGNSVGGVVEVIARNVPAGLGSPVFDKLEADLAKACLSLPASKGFEIGSGFGGTMLTGLDHNDPFYVDSDGRTRTCANRSGGVQGGISNGEPIVLRIAFKPTSTIGKVQDTVTRGGQWTQLRGKGRHDACVLPRAVPMVESMVALVLADHLLQQIAQCSVLPTDEATSPNPLGPVPVAGSILSNAALVSKKHDK